MELNTVVKLGVIILDKKMANSFSELMFKNQHLFKFNYHFSI